MAAMRPRSHTAIAAAAAQRLLPAYSAYAERTGNDGDHVLRSILDCVWDGVVSGAFSDNELLGFERKAVSLMPDEGEPGQPLELACAEDAATAVAYAVRSWLNQSSQDAAWAMRRVYDTLDSFVTDQEKIDISVKGAEKRILENPLIQAELLRQRQDIDEVLNSCNEEQLVDAIKRMRSRSKQVQLFG